MLANTLITKLWKNGYIPTIEGITLFDENKVKVFDIRIYPQVHTIYQDTIIFSDYMNNHPDDITAYDIYGIKDIGDNLLKFGIGGFGGDGFVACFSKQTQQLQWLFFSSFINPIHQVDYHHTYLVLINNNDDRIILDLKNKELYATKP